MARQIFRDDPEAVNIGCDTGQGDQGAFPPAQ